MLTNCPFCRKDLNFSEAQLDKIEKALEPLQEGKYLKIGCPHCKKSITLDRSGEVVPESGGAAPAQPKKTIERTRGQIL